MSRRGRATTAMTPMITIVMISSIMVKPDGRRSGAIGGVVIACAF
jgi:hypothetical protein